MHLQKTKEHVANSPDLDEIQRRPALKKLLARVRSLTSRPVNFRHMSDWKQTIPGQPEILHSPAMLPTDNSYDIYLNDILPEQMAVHELLHVVLIEEGYPDIKFNDWKAPARSPNRSKFERFYDGLVNKLQHPEIYRRMSTEYDQDMPPYRAHVTVGLIDASSFNLSSGPLSFPLGKQTSIVDIIDHLYLQPESRQNLERYQSLAPETYAIARSIQQEMDQIGFNTPLQALRCLNLFLDRIIDYGKAINATPDNGLWRALSWHLPNSAGTL